MPWVKLDDGLADHPKIVAAGPMAGWLYVCGLTYCSRFLTDGFIPAAQVRRLADIPDWAKQAAQLVKVGLWDQCDDGYQVHDFLEYNPSAEKVRAERKAAQARMQRNRSPEVRPNKTRTSPEVLLPRPVPVLNDESTTSTSSGPSPEPAVAAADVYIRTLDKTFDPMAKKYAGLDPQFSRGWLVKTMREAATDKVRQPLGYDALNEGMMNAYERIAESLSNGHQRKGSVTGLARTIIFGALEEAAL